MKTLKQRRPKRLTKLRIDEVSVCDSGAGRGVEVVLMKRDVGFNDAGELTIDGVPRWRRKMTGGVTKVDTGDTSLDRALEEIEETKRFAKAHAAPLTEDHPMETSEVMKAAVAKVDDRIAAIIAKSDKPISRVVAIGRMASSSDPRDIEAWQLHKSIASVPATPVSAPAPVSPAFLKMQKKAAKLAQKEGISQASAFSKIYASRPDLAQADKQFFFNKAAGGGQRA